MITHFRVRNFKALRDITIEPSSVNVIIGPNSSGKSSLLQALDFLRAFFSSSIEVYLDRAGWKYRDIPNVLAQSKTVQWDITVELGPGPGGVGEGRYDYSVSLSPRRYLGIGREQLLYTPPNGESVQLLKRTGRRVTVHDPATGAARTHSIPNLPAGAVGVFGFDRRDRLSEMGYFTAWVRRLRYFLPMDPKTLRRPDRGGFRSLGQSGEHLAPMLAHMKKENPERFGGLLSRMKGVFPNISDISFSGTGWGWRSIRLHETVGGREFALNNEQLGDGFLRLLALTSFLYLDRVPRVVMFEEPENGVHPRLLRDMVQVLKELTLRKDPRRTQVFFTTHSPYVLDEFYDHPEQVWIMDSLVGKGGAQVKRLGDRSQLEKLKKAFPSLGEAWFHSAIGGNPPSLLF